MENKEKANENQSLGYLICSIFWLDSNFTFIVSLIKCPSLSFARAHLLHLYVTLDIPMTCSEILQFCCEVNDRDGDRDGEISQDMTRVLHKLVLSI